MKRKSFIFSAIAIIISPFSVSAKAFITSIKKGFKTSAGEGRIHGHIKLKGVNSNILDLKVSGNDNDGGFALFEQTYLSQGMGTPLHIHHLQDEVFYVIEGNYYFQVGEDKYQLGAGDSIFLPMKVPHAWTQVSEKGKMMVLFQPAGKMESFFIKLAAMDHEPSKAALSQLFADNEMKIVGPILKVN